MTSSKRQYSSRQTLTALDSMNRTAQYLILWLCLAYLGLVSSMDVPSGQMPSELSSVLEELDDLPELSVYVGGQHGKGLFRIGSWKQPLYQIGCIAYQF